MEFSSIRLKEIRSSLGINKAEAAKMLHMTAMGYGRYEKGERVPSYQTVCYMAHIFGTSADYLYGLTDDPAPDEIVVSLENDPELFKVVYIIKNMNMKSRDRILAYTEMLMEKTD